jgi:hypothetical protein
MQIDIAVLCVVFLFQYVRWWKSQKIARDLWRAQKGDFYIYKSGEAKKPRSYIQTAGGTRMYTKKLLLTIFLFLPIVACDSSDSQSPEGGTEQQLVILIDEAHNNSHTAAGSYAPFARLLRDNGYDVRPSNSLFNSDALEQADVLVTSNALAAQNINDWSLPTPSAFTNDEIEAVRSWVESGGSLLLIADHMPFPGAASDLAMSFGVAFNNGFAIDTLYLQLPDSCLSGEQIQIFSRSDGSLVDHFIINGRSTEEQVDSVATFTGQAFQADGEIQPLLVFGPSAISLMPETAWEFPPGTPQISVDGWFQGAVMEYGEGRAAFFGEAAMFTEQFCNNNIPMGMNAPEAAQNERFLLNLFLWLTEGMKVSAVYQGGSLSMV